MQWQEWANRVTQRVKHVVLFGDLAETLEKRLAEAGCKQMTRVDGLETAVTAAAHMATAGDIVLLSPGGTSFDAFNDFAERGERFRDWVNQL